MESRFSISTPASPSTRSSPLLADELLLNASAAASSSEDGGESSSSSAPKHAAAAARRMAGAARSRGSSIMGRPAPRGAASSSSSRGRGSPSATPLAPHARPSFAPASATAAAATFQSLDIFEDFRAPARLGAGLAPPPKRSKRKCEWSSGSSGGGGGGRRRARQEERSVLGKVMERESQSQSSCGGSQAQSQDRPRAVRSAHAKLFGDMTLQATLDTHDPTSAAKKLEYLQRRSKVLEIVSTRNMVFALTQTGVCAAFSRATNERLCFLNLTNDEVVRSLFYNKVNDSVITVSVYKQDNFSSLRCRSTAIEYVRRGRPEQGFNLFETEQLCWPGFVEFDDVNAKVLTFSAKDKAYKVWALRDYSLLYSVLDEEIHEIKISPGIMLIIFHRLRQGKDKISLEIRSMESGEVLKSFHHMLKDKQIDFIEQFNEKLLIKQEDECLSIVDVCTMAHVRVPEATFSTPQAFIFLYENQMFLTFKKNQVTVWNLDGELVTQFEDHTLWEAQCNTNNIFITKRQDQILSYCRNGRGESMSGAINVSSTLTGRSIGKITAPEGGGREEGEGALDRVTAIYFNEERNEVYTGDEQGCLSVWARG